MPRPKKSDGVAGIANSAQKKATKVPAKRKPKAPRILKAPKVLVSTDLEASSEINASTLFLYLNTTSGRVETTHEIPCQSITLKMARVHFKTIQDAQTNCCIGIVLSIFGPVQLNNNLQVSVIPIMGDYSKVDVITYPDVTMTMGKKLPRTFQYSIIDLRTNQLVTSIDFAELLFQYEIGVVN